MGGQASTRPARLLRLEKTAGALDEGLRRRTMPLRWAVDIYEAGTEPEYRVPVSGMVDLVRGAAERIGHIGRRVRDTADAFARADGRNPADYLDWQDDPTFKANENWFDCGPGMDGRVPTATPWPSFSAGSRGNSGSTGSPGSRGASGLSGTSGSSGSSGSSTSSGSPNETDRILTVIHTGNTAIGSVVGVVGRLDPTKAQPAVSKTLGAVGKGLTVLQAYRNDQEHVGLDRAQRAVLTGALTTSGTKLGGWAGAAAAAQLCSPGGLAAATACATIGGFLGAMGGGWALGKVAEKVNEDPPAQHNANLLAKKIEDPLGNGNSVIPIIRAG